MIARLIVQTVLWLAGMGAVLFGAAGTFAWPADDTCVIKLCAYETPFQTTFTLKFEGDQVTLNSEANVAFGPTKRPQLVGRAD